MDAQTRVGGALGRTLGGRYELRRVLGVGGMGTVYEAVHAFTQRRVAVKVLHRSVVQAVPTIGVRFLREAQAAASIDHPGIVDVLDAGQDDGTGDLYLVLELLEGEDLDRALQSGRLTPTDVVRIVADVLEPLAAAHDKGFVHRDIKPANIFLLEGSGGQRQVKLLDFGIVKPQHQADITMSGALVGTIDYMSPEQVRGEGVGPSVDLWALAATLFHALAGRPPVVAPNRIELLRRVGIGVTTPVLELAPSTPVAVAGVVDRALSERLEDRYPDAKSMQVALREALAAMRGAAAEVTAYVRGPLSGDEPTVRARTPILPALVPDVGPEEDSRPTPPLPVLPHAAPPEEVAGTRITTSPSAPAGGARALRAPIIAGLLAFLIVGVGFVALRSRPPPDQPVAPAASSAEPSLGADPAPLDVPPAEADPGAPTGRAADATAPELEAPRSAPPVEARTEAAPSVTESPAPEPKTRAAPRRRRAPRKVTRPEPPPEAAPTPDRSPEEPLRAYE